MAEMIHAILMSIEGAFRVGMGFALADNSEGLLHILRELFRDCIWIWWKDGWH